MGTQLSGSKLKLYKAIDEILWNDWDPIGVNEVGDNVRDEYYGYIPVIYEMVLSGSSIESIAAKLFYFVTIEMGLLGTQEKNIEIAEKIVEAYKECFK